MSVPARSTISYAVSGALTTDSSAQTASHRAIAFVVVRMCLDRGMPLYLARRAAAGLDRMPRDDTLASVLAQLDGWWARMLRCVTDLSHADGTTFETTAGSSYRTAEPS
jgi:hypothetical protein